MFVKEYVISLDTNAMVLEIMAIQPARALIPPKYGNLLSDRSVKALSIYHNVMPTMGTAVS